MNELPPLFRKCAPFSCTHIEYEMRYTITVHEISMIIHFTYTPCTQYTNSVEHSARRIPYNSIENTANTQSYILLEITLKTDKLNRIYIVNPKSFDWKIKIQNQI